MGILVRKYKGRPQGRRVLGSTREGSTSEESLREERSREY